MNYIDPTGLLLWDLIDAGEGYGAIAADYWATQSTSPTNTWYETAAYSTAGALASLWTPDTSDATAMTLASACVPTSVASGVQRGGWMNANRYLRIGYGKHGRDKVFRLSGDALKWIEQRIPGAKK